MGFYFLYSMKITKHICFYYCEDRFKYLNKIIDEVNTYTYRTDIFIHTNINFSDKQILHTNTNGSLMLVVHDMKDQHPFTLTWKARSLLHQQKDLYDIFIYVEDDILIPSEAILYWVRYKDSVMKHGYNLGFLRIERDAKGIEYTSDLWIHDSSTSEGYLTEGLEVESIQFVKNGVNPYCGFWIYDANEFRRFVESPYYDLEKSFPMFFSHGYHIRESSAIGLHDKVLRWYKGTIIPIQNGSLDPCCKVYHLPNNYINEVGSKLHKYDTLLKLNPSKESV
jgi:hypothetical protein